MEGQMKKIGKRITLAVIAFVVLILFLKAITIIPAGKVGVVHLFGKVRDNELHSGFHIINPLVRVTDMTIRTEEYTMSIASSEGKRQGDDSILSLTKEGLSVELDVTVLYRLMPDTASDVYKELGTKYEEKIIRPQIRTAIRNVASLYTAKEIYGEKRLEVSTSIEAQLSNNLTKRGIEVEQILLRNVNLPNELAKAIESKLTAEQQIEQKNFEVEVAKKEAERKIAEAEGIKKSQEIINRSLTSAYLKWYSIEMMKSLVGSENTTFLFIPTDSSGTPIITLPMK